MLKHFLSCCDNNFTYLKSKASFLMEKILEPPLLMSGTKWWYSTLYCHLILVKILFNITQTRNISGKDISRKVEIFILFKDYMTE